MFLAIDQDHDSLQMYVMMGQINSDNHPESQIVDTALEEPKGEMEDDHISESSSDAYFELPTVSQLESKFL